MNNRLTGLALLVLPIMMVLTLDCAQAGKKEDKEINRRLAALQATIESQGETIESLTAQISAQTQVIQQLATAETPDIVVDNNVEGQLICVWRDD